MKFNELPLSKEILRAIDEIGYQEATYIQSACIPTILNGGDVIGQSQTGTGKTAAFSIPLIEKIENHKSKKPKAIILTPTRELALQVTQEIRKFSKYKEGIKVVTIYGGAPIQKQISELKGSTAIVVGTPGRVLDHIKRKTLRLDECETIILDEADEMLNMGFREDIESVIQEMNPEHQTVLFSATMPKAILEITHLYQTNPVHIKTPISEISASKIEQCYYEVNQSDKRKALIQLMQVYPYSLAMVFCNTKKMVDDLTQELVGRGYAACAIHGDMKQEMRLQVLDKFKQRKINILIATDVAARGIDVDSMDIVFNFDFPQEDEYYIHRIGRTGRAGKDGVAVTLITPRQRHLIRNIEYKTKAKMIKKELPKGEEIRKMRLDQLRVEIEESMSKQVPEEISYMLYEMTTDGFSYQDIAETLMHRVLGNEIFEEIKSPKKSNSLVVTHKSMATITLDVGRKHEVQPAHIVSAVAEASGISGRDIGKIKIYEKESTVEIPEQFLNEITTALLNTTIKGYEIHISTGKNYGRLEKKRRDDKRGNNYGRKSDDRKSDGRRDRKKSDSKDGRRKPRKKKED
ncbi:MAG: DEAD/DEAH box helicase [Erysipelotrichaceae bacterium]